VKRYHVTTFGCQMNAHDSERVRGMLEELGYGEAPDQQSADVVVFNTCTIREKPDQKLFNQLAHVEHLKKKDPNRIVAVGGCLVEAQQDVLFKQFPFVDVAFGPGRIDTLGEYLAGESGISGRAFNAGFYGTEDERRFAAELPTRRAAEHQAWVQISMGCNSVCSYCIVPRVRGKEKSRDFAHIVGEVERLAADGVREVTLLGQNVNSYGRDLPKEERVTFAELLRAVDVVDGIERIRFTSPHPKDMRDDVIAAMVECPAVCEQVHLPVQSGSSRVLKAMRRTYTRERYLTLVDKIREAMPDISMTTDIIVGFPGETREEFEETVSLAREVEYDGAFTFIYSSRSGTEAAQMEDQLPQEEKQERLAELVEVVRECSERRNARHIGTTLDVLVEGTSRTDDDRITGRTRGGIRVNFTGEADAGQLVDVAIERSTSGSLGGAMIAGSAR
jgi:tRNA-2-methylthio-N6-dimethylallyladenosine synthase